MPAAMSARGLCIEGHFATDQDVPPSGYYLPKKMGRYPKMSPGRRRMLEVALTVLFLVMIGMIAWGYVVAEHKVPH